MEYTVRKTTAEDLSAVMEIVEQARAYMKEKGIPQWQDGYPNRSSFETDIHNGSGYVLCEDDTVIAVAAVIDRRDPDYTYIENGNWLNDEDYIVIHRIAVKQDHKGKRMAGKILDEAVRLARKKGIRNLRADTHELNLSMRRFLEREGFIPCGRVYIRGTEPRIAYQKEI